MTTKDSCDWEGFMKEDGGVGLGHEGEEASK